MKMTKKILTVAVVAAALFGLAGCKPEIGDIKWDDKGTATGTQIVKVSQTNSNDSTMRGMKRVASIPRGKGTCVVRQFKQTATSYDGMVGFASYVVQNKDDPNAENYNTYNFLVVGVQNCKGKTRTYASYFCNIRENEMSTQNFGAVKKDSNGKTVNNVKAKVDHSLTEPYEVVIPMSGSKTYNSEGFVELPEVTFDKNGELKVAIRFEEYTNGNIYIEWAKNPKENLAAASCEYDESDVICYATADGDTIGRTKESKGTLWTYANIQKGATLNAQWNLYDVSMFQSSLAADDDTFDGFGDILFEEVK